MAVLRGRLIHSKLLSVYLGFGISLSFMAGLSLVVEVAEASSGERWFATDVDQGCWPNPRTGQRGYLYNVDENLDGAVDFAVWFFESDEFSYYDTLGDKYYLTSPTERSLHQWALVWFGFKATGACDLDEHALGWWEVRLSPGSIYSSLPKLELQAQMGVAYGQSITVECSPWGLPGCVPGPFTLDLTQIWFSSGEWHGDGVLYNDLTGKQVPPHSSWQSSEMDWETEIQSQGHPSWPLKYPFASSTDVPDTSVCAPGGQGYPGGTLAPNGGLAFTSPSPEIPGGTGVLMQYFFGYPTGYCWFVEEGPVAGFTFSPDECSVVNYPVVGHPVTFDASATFFPPSGGFNTYDWTFGDGAQVTASSSPLATHTYASHGAYTVTLYAASWEVPGPATGLDTLSYALFVDSDLSGTISGTVVDEWDGDPVAYADVTLTGCAHAYSVSANSQGQFTLGAHSDIYDVEAERCDYHTGSASVTVSPGAMSQITIELNKRPLSPVHGYVTGGFFPPGSPLSNAIVSNYCTTYSDLTDGNGYYVLWIPWDVPIQVTAQKSGYVSVTKTVTVPYGVPPIYTRLDFYLPQDCPWCPN